MHKRLRLVILSLPLMVATARPGGTAPPEADSIVGRVTDSQGSPVTGAAVTAMPWRQPFSRRRPAARSDAEGRFTLPTGRNVAGWDLEVRAAGFLTWMAWAEPSHGMLEVALATPFTGTIRMTFEGEQPPAKLPVLVDASVPTTYRTYRWWAKLADGAVQLGPLGDPPPPCGPARFLITAQGYSGEADGVLLPGTSAQTVRVKLRRTTQPDTGGRVLDGAGRPRAGVRVGLDSPLPWHSSVTDAEGRFNLFDVAPGVHTATLMGSTQGVEFVALRAGRVDAAFAPRGLNSVATRTIAPRIQGRGSARHDHVAVYYQPLGYADAHGVPACMSDGRRLPLEGSSQDPGQLELGPYQIWGSNVAAAGPILTLEVTAGSEPLRVEVPAPPDLVPLTGRLLMASGHAAGAEVLVSGPRSDWRRSFTQELSADEGGRFRASAVPGARARLECTSTDGKFSAVLLIDEVPKGGAEDLVIRLRELGGLRAAVLGINLPTAGPPRGAYLAGLHRGDDQLRWLGGLFLGSKRLVGSAHAGQMLLYAVTDDQVSWPPLEVDVQEGEVLRELVLRLRPSPGQIVRVTDPAGRPLDDVRVQLRGDRVTWDKREARTDAAGRARIGGLLPGQATIEAWRPDLPGCAHASVEVPAPDQPASEVVLVLGSPVGR